MSLLTSVCDAVVQLDHEMKLVEAKALSILLYQRTSPDLTGASGLLGGGRCYCVGGCAVHSLGLWSASIFGMKRHTFEVRDFKTDLDPKALQGLIPLCSSS